MCFGNADTGHPYDFAVVDGRPVPAKHQHVHQLYSRPQEIVMASDGYPMLFATLGQSEARLQELNSIDPLCFRENKSTKGLSPGLNSFDDRAYIRFVAE